MCHKNKQKPWHSCAAPLSRDAVSLNTSQYIEYLEIDPFPTISQFGVLDPAAAGTTLAC